MRAPEKPDVIAVAERIDIHSSFPLRCGIESTTGGRMPQPYALDFSASGSASIVPTLIRESLQWCTLSDGRVEVSVDVLNVHEVSTSEEVLVFAAAPFGAFIGGIPVARVAVGALDPGESQRVSTTVDRRRLDLMGLGSHLFESAKSAGADGAVHPERHAQWIGNFNVYFDRDPSSAVERHRAFDLRVPANSYVNAGFFVMESSPFELTAECSSPDWETQINAPNFAATLPKSLLRSRFRTFQKFKGFRLLTLRTPAATDRSAKVTVNVTRLRDTLTVPVEFEFHTVDGWGNTVGCVKV